jgi:hypothetical protein
MVPWFLKETIGKVCGITYSPKSFGGYKETHEPGFSQKRSDLIFSSHTSKNLVIEW